MEENNSEKFTNKILEKIKTDHIKPSAKWNFVLREYLFWVLLIISVFIGSLAVAVIIFIIKDGSIFIQIPDWSLKRLLIFIPYFWIMLLVVFIALAYFNLKHTKQGYKFNPYLIILISVLFSLVIGSIVYAFGISEKVENNMYDHFMPYRKIMHQQMKPFSNPENGRLMGIVLKNGYPEFELREFEGKKWLIKINEPMNFPVGARLNIFGEKEDESHFEAKQISPLLGKMGKRKMMLNLNERNFPMPAY